MILRKEKNTDGELSISLVAEIEGQIVGHIAFSPITISDGTSGWYGMGPVLYCQTIRNRAQEKHLPMKVCLC